jgi:hypothetical protein
MNEICRGSFFKKDYGGIYSIVGNRPGNEIYFIGLIDVLTTFDLKKKAEHVLKSVKNLNNVRPIIHNHILTQSQSHYHTITLSYSIVVFFSLFVFVCCSAECSSSLRVLLLCRKKFLQSHQSLTNTDF